MEKSATATTPSTQNGPPQVGTVAPDYGLVDIEGQSVQLSDFWRDKPLALVFLRHLGCTFCQQQLAWLKQDYPRFQSAGAEVVCIAEGDAKVGKAYAILYDLPFPLLLSDSDLGIYREYGLLRGSAIDLLKPSLLLRGLKSFLQGHIQTKLEGDPGQLGGAFVIDRSGTVRYLYRSKDASDTVKVETLIDAVTKLRG
jgi:peroxiredoxin